MPRCSTPRCSREAPLEAGAPNLWTLGQDSAPMCVPCYLALLEGLRRHPSEVGYEISDYSLLSDSDRDALLGE